MKKLRKLLLKVFAVLTAAGLAAIAAMYGTVTGDRLFYIDSRLGYLCAVSFRPVCLMTSALLLFWLVLIVRKIKAAAQIQR